VNNLDSGKRRKDFFFFSLLISIKNKVQKPQNPYLRSKQRSITGFWPFGTDFGGLSRGKPRGIRPVTIKSAFFHI